jgi:putative membrane protein
MFALIANWFLSALSLFIVSRIVPGIFVENFGSALIAVVVIGLVNALIKPILLLLTLPLTIMTLGLFALVINALMLMLAGSVLPGFRVEGFVAALIGSILLSLITILLHSLVR